MAPNVVVVAASTRSTSVITNALITTTFNLLNNNNNNQHDELNPFDSENRLAKMSEQQNVANRVISSPNGRVDNGQFEFPYNDLATLKQPPFHRTYAVANDSGNYYIVGVLFMISIIGLLLYVNLYYEYCFRDTCYQMSQWKGCCFLKLFIITSYSPRRAQPHQHHADSQNATSLVESGNNAGNNHNHHHNNTNSVNRGSCHETDARTKSTDVALTPEKKQEPVVAVVKTPSRVTDSTNNYYKSNKIVQV